MHAGRADSKISLAIRVDGDVGKKSARSPSTTLLRQRDDTVRDDFENEKKSRYLTTLTEQTKDERYVSTTTFDTKTPFLKILFLFFGGNSIWGFKKREQRNMYNKNDTGAFAPFL